MNYPKEVYWLALSQWKGIGPAYAQQLLGKIESPAYLFKENVESLKREFEELPASIWAQDREQLLEWAQSQHRKAVDKNVQVITLEDDSYPLRFRHFEQMPIVLFYKGNAPLNNRRVIGLVGTRSPSEKGKLFCEKLIEELRVFDPLIVSGLAYGIDVTAHRASLKQQLQTIGIMGTGMQEIYPFQHRGIASDMLKQGGILTQFAFGEGPDREHFPMRNKLIAAMSDALIVIESKRKGGSMITAQMANDMNKDVFAVPGRPADQKSEGCNLLIKSHRANLLESADDLAYVMRWEKIDEPQDVQRKLFVELEPDEELILECIRKSKEISIDQLSGEMKKPVNELANLLLQLEFKSLIKSLPGNRYIST